jgi:hypothetical protein
LAHTLSRQKNQQQQLAKLLAADAAARADFVRLGGLVAVLQRLGGDDDGVDDGRAATAAAVAAANAAADDAGSGNADGGSSSNNDGGNNDGGNNDGGNSSSSSSSSRSTNGYATALREARRAIVAAYPADVVRYFSPSMSRELLQRLQADAAAAASAAAAATVV